jgi:hypothetical protein
MKRLLLCICALLLGSAAFGIQAADSLRPEVGKPLQAAQELIKAQKYREALAKVGEADAVPNKTAYESFILERMRGAAAMGAGDPDTAAKAFSAVIDSGKLSNEESLKLMLAVADTYARAKDYGKTVTWVQRYQKAGGTDPQAETLIAQSYYLNGDYASAAKELQGQFAAQEKAGRIPTEEQYQLLASCYLKQNDKAGYASVLQQVVIHYPKQEYWADLLNQIQRKPGFSDRLSLDVYRLMLATGTLKTASDYMEMAQLALQAGYPTEAQKVIAQGYASKVLGTGQEAARQQRLKDLADKQAKDDQKTLDTDVQTAQAKDANAMVATGYNLILNGKTQQGLALMEQGLSKGNLKYPDEAKLHLGLAYLNSGDKAKALQTFKTVGGEDGSADLAKLWIAQSRAT